MANMMEKIGDKLHMGGDKKEDPHTVGATHAPHYAALPGYGAAWSKAGRAKLRREQKGGALQVQSTMVDNLQAAMHSVDHMAQGIAAQTTCNARGFCGHKLATGISQVKLCQ
ncbi:hypothetical protein GOP47_0012468, partial [Adiantum capillus-veneris]